MLSRQSGPHPASMQSLVSSSHRSSSRAGGGVANPCRLTPDFDAEVYCGLTEPLDLQRQGGGRGQRQGGGCRSRRSRNLGIGRHPSWRHVGRGCASRAKRVGCLRSALLAAFVLILVGVIVTSSYAIDRRFSQLPQLLYAGLCLCSIGLFVIVVAVTMLVTRQMGKHQLHRDHHHQQHQQQLHLATTSTTSSGFSATPASSGRGSGGSSNRVPIWYIGCHRDTATAYCPPVPPSYWESSASTSAAAATAAVSRNSQQYRQHQQQQQQQPLPSRSQSRASTVATTAAGSPTPPPLPPSRQSRLQPPLPPVPQSQPQPQQQPPPPPSYQEALRCLEETSLSSDSQRGRRWHWQPPNAGSCDQLSVLKWTVQQHHQHHQYQQQPQQLPVDSHDGSRAQLRRCESSSFIGEPILV